MFVLASRRIFSVALGARLLLLAAPTLAHPGPGRPLAPTPHTAPVLAAAAAPALGATAAVSAPNTVQLRGVVLNADGRPCPGASVFPAGAPRQLVVTDAQGAFVLTVPAGTALALQVEYFGVGSSRVAINQPSAEPLRITLGQ